MAGNFDDYWADELERTAALRKATKLTISVEKFRAELERAWRNGYNASDGARQFGEVFGSLLRRR